MKHNNQKTKIYQWILQLNLINNRQNRGLNYLPENFEDGILFAEIINQYEGVYLQ